MNYRLLFTTFYALILILPNRLSGQEEFPAGIPLATIFADYKQQLNGENSFHGFNVTRAYIGYKYQVERRLSAQILLDVGVPLATEDVLSNRYTYLKNACISYKLNNFTATAGITNLRGSSVQNRFWAKRYLAKPFLLRYKYVNIADLGIVVDYKISNRISIDAAILNGEGYTKIQMDETLQFAGGITFMPLNGFEIRFYGDLYKAETYAQNTLAVFTGYRNEKFTIAFQFNYKSDADLTDMHNIFGYSGNISYRITPKFELFSRYDRSGSVVPDGETTPWNETNDGSLFIGGIQYTYSGNLRFALDYQGWSPDNNTTERVDYIQIDCEFRF